VEFRAQVGLSNFKNYFVKGHYLSLKRPMAIQSLIYPIPPAHGLGLGIHLTLDVSGGGKFGPNTEEIESLNYSVQASVLDQMYPAIKQLFHKIEKEDLNLGYAGVRSKITTIDGRLQRDFILSGPREHGVEGYFEFLGIESPGLTAAPALAELMTEKIFKHS
jgi:L-2-hydroxyglutarate oxidase LhgO